MAPDGPRNARPSRPELELAGDAQLVIRVATGEEAALAELYRRHGSGVYGLALRLLGRSDLAEEVLQEVMVAPWERPDPFDPDRGHPRPYLLRVAHGKAVDRLRSETARGRRELAYFDGHTYREVARILQQPEGTIKGRIRLGLRKLADRLDAAGLGPPRPGAGQPRTQQDPR